MSPTQEFVYGCYCHGPTLGHNYSGSCNAAAQRNRAFVTKEFSNSEIKPGGSSNQGSDVPWPDLLQPGLHAVTKALVKLEVPRATSGKTDHYEDGGTELVRPTQSNVTYPCVGIDWCELRITFFILRDIKKRGQQQSRCSRCILLHNICYRIDRSIILRSQIIVELSLSSLYFCGENSVPLSTRVCVRAPGLKNNAGIYCLAINPLAQPAIANVSITCQNYFSVCC